jgi:hypothetical protein
MKTIKIQIIFDPTPSNPGWYARAIRADGQERDIPLSETDSCIVPDEDDVRDAVASDCLASDVADDCDIEVVS